MWDVYMFYFFFFKQKTAYELRISDWSSDVCSSISEPIDAVVDTTGAGDLFAAGFLHGQAQGHDLEKSLRLGAICAAEIISHYGARPQSDMKALIADKKLGRASCGERGCQYVYIPVVAVDLIKQQPISRSVIS